MNTVVKYTDEHGKKFNWSGEEVVDCELCGAATTSKSTKRCDSCWELEMRIQRHPDLAEKILTNLKRSRHAAGE